MLCYMGIPEVIQEMRDKRGMTIAEIARKMEKPESTVYQLARGEYTNITLDTLERLAVAYGTPSWQLLRRLRESEPTTKGSKTSAA